MAYTQCGGGLSYYRTPSGSEVDFIWQRAARRIGIEVKASARWRPEFGRTLQELISEGVVGAGVGVYLGDTILRDGALRVLPLREFLRQLAVGKILPTAARS
jgi:predicted AAA+ superfamily ATPase